MKPHDCDSICESRRFWWYLTYLCILVGCIGLALCHFLFSLAIRRRIKQDARDYHANRVSRPPIYTTDASEQINNFESIQDGIKISTDGISDLIIEMTNGVPLNNLSSMSSMTNTTDGYHNHRPLQTTPEEQNKEFGNKIVEVEVHMENGVSSAQSLQHHHQQQQHYRNAVVTAPVTVAVATVSAAVAEQVRDQNPEKEIFGNTSRPPSSPSYFDISDIVYSPENVRKASKSKTC